MKLLNALLQEVKMKSRILVVDDEKEIADLLEIYLKSEDYDVLKC